MLGIQFEDLTRNQGHSCQGLEFPANFFFAAAARRLADAPMTSGLTQFATSKSSERLPTYGGAVHYSFGAVPGREPELLVLGMGGTIDKDYPRSTKGYAFEIDFPAADRVLHELPFFALPFATRSIVRKDSTEIGDAERDLLETAVKGATCSRILVTHGTDTMIETARRLQKSGAVKGKTVAFTGAMKPERFKDSDATFNLGTAVAATGLLPAGSVVVAMGGRIVDAAKCSRDEASGLFVEKK